MQQTICADISIGVKKPLPTANRPNQAGIAILYSLFFLLFCSDTKSNID